MRVGVAIFSCDRGLGLGVTGDYGRVFDIHVLCGGMMPSLAELMAAVAESGPRPSPRVPDVRGS